MVMTIVQERVKGLPAMTNLAAATYLSKVNSLDAAAAGDNAAMLHSILAKRIEIPLPELPSLLGMSETAAHTVVDNLRRTGEFVVVRRTDDQGNTLFSLRRG